MHSPRFELNDEDMRNHLQTLIKVCEVLAEHDPKFKKLLRDIDEVCDFKHGSF